MTQTLDQGTTTEPKEPRRPKRATLSRKRRRRPVRRFMIVSHRWLSLVLGLVLLAITTSGAILMYRPEMNRVQFSDAYDASGKAPTISLPEAREIVLDAHPKFEATSVQFEHGVYRVTDYTTSWTVDPGTGEILGRVGKTASWLRFLDNLHECFLSCEDYPGTINLLTKEIPHTSWLGFEGAKVTGGGLALGVLGILLLYLSLTGIWLWFPRPSKWRSSMNVRWKRGRFARDTDLHKVAGMIVIPFLLMWAITGAGFEFGFMEKGWYAATPGKHREYPEPLSEKLPKGTKAPDITPDAAIEAAQALHPDAELLTIDVPAKDDATAAYTMWLADGFDPYGQAEYPGDLGVYVDRHTGEARDFYGAKGEATAQVIWDQWNFPTHTGFVVNGWWRLIWLFFALSPLLLAITGVSTWLVRRKANKARRAARKKGRATPPIPEDLAEELVEDPEMDPALATTVAEDAT